MVTIPFDNLPSATTAEPAARPPGTLPARESDEASFDAHWRDAPSDDAPAPEMDENRAPGEAPPAGSEPTDADEAAAQSDPPQPEPAETDLDHESQPEEASAAAVLPNDPSAVQRIQILAMIEPQAASPEAVQAVEAATPPVSAPAQTAATEAGDAEAVPPAGPQQIPTEPLQPLPNLQDVPSPRNGQSPPEAQIQLGPPKPAKQNAAQNAAAEQAAPHPAPIETSRPTESPRPRTAPREPDAAGLPAPPIQNPDPTPAQPVARKPLEPGQKPRQTTPERQEPPASGTDAPTGDKSDAGAADPASRLPHHLFARTAAPRASRRWISHADQARFVQRVARAVHAARNRNGYVRLRLSPPELGSLRLEVKLQRGALTARIEADTLMARTILLDHMPLLRDRLAEQGVRVERFEVNVPDRQQSGLPDAPADQRHPGGQSPAGPPPRSGDAPPEDAVRAPATSLGSIGNQQINVVI